MYELFSFNRLFLLRKKHALRRILACLLFVAVCLLPACKRAVDYFDYVSELRSNIFLDAADGFSLRVYSVSKETPYLSDGIPQTVTARTEVYLLAPQGSKAYTLQFDFQGNVYGGDMSYDNARGEYYYFCSLDVSVASELHCRISGDDTSVSFCARSVTDEETLAPREILKIVQASEETLFSALTDEYGFSGEIYIRLLYEDAPYYYVGVIERTGTTHAFLLNAKTGKLLAKRST